MQNLIYCQQSNDETIADSSLACICRADGARRVGRDALPPPPGNGAEVHRRPVDFCGDLSNSDLVDCATVLPALCRQERPVEKGLPGRACGGEALWGPEV